MSPSPATLSVDSTALAGEGIFARVEAIGKGSSRTGWMLACCFAFLVHGGGGYAAHYLHDVHGFVQLVSDTVAARLTATVEIEDFPEPEPEPEVAEPEPEPEPEPEVAPPEPEPEPETVAPLPVAEEPPTDAAPPPAAAEAGQILAAEPDPSEPLDLTADGFITGSGTSFAGGKTASNGTSKKAVRDENARAGGVPGAKGKTEGARPAPAVDKSKPPGIPSGAFWKRCGFPAEALAEQIDEEVVVLVVVVGPDSKPVTVNVLKDPGYGFGARAKRCAMRGTFPAGRDKWGNPTTRATAPFRVRFVQD